MSRVVAPPITTRPAALTGGPVQASVVTGAASVLAVGALWLVTHYGPRQGALLLVGAALGLTLHHAVFGFTRAYRDLVTVGDGRGVRAQLLMLAVATVLFAPVLAAGEVFGVAVGGAVAPASVSVLVGAFVFAVGMQVAGGCGSGMLYHLGAGVTPMLATLVGFVAGAVLATFHMPFWWALPSLGEVSLAERLGWSGAVVLQLAVCALLALVSWVFERRRVGARPSLRAPVTGWRRVVQGPWPLGVGAVLLALLNLVTLVVAGTPWSITWAFALWGAKGLVAMGYDLSGVAFWSGEFQQSALAAPVFADVTSVMDLGLVLGALLGAGLAGRFAPRRRVPARRVAAAVLGGLLLGYGSRIAYGCNIGALFGGIASTSLHGWLWAAAALAGTPLGVWLRGRFGVECAHPRA
ncbi:MAG: hypothetical protein DME11_20005 [Candidatus Rokuibacteriota bacterium]|nr:MAG: hypothetical protein DME11_20005 [Candidatus Rokubacteria bacterium]